MRDHSASREVVHGVAIDAEELGDLIGGHHVARRLGRDNRRGRDDGRLEGARCRRIEKLLERGDERTKRLECLTFEELARCRRGVVGGVCVRRRLIVVGDGGHENRRSMASRFARIHNATTSGEVWSRVTTTETTPGSSAFSAAMKPGAIRARRSTSWPWR